MEQIKSTAEKVKTNRQATVAEETDCLPQTAPGSLPNVETGLSVGEYVSPLEHLRLEGEEGKVLDPDKLLCKFELGGKCMDSTCRFQHCRPQ